MCQKRRQTVTRSIAHTNTIANIPSWNAKVTMCHVMAIYYLVFFHHNFKCRMFNWRVLIQTKQQLAIFLLSTYHHNHHLLLLSIIPRIKNNRIIFFLSFFISSYCYYINIYLWWTTHLYKICTHTDTQSCWDYGNTQ